MKLIIPAVIAKAIAGIVTNPGEGLKTVYDETEFLHDMTAEKISGLVFMVAQHGNITTLKTMKGIATTVRLIIYALHRNGFSQYETALMMLSVGGKHNAAVASMKMIDAITATITMQDEEGSRTAKAT